MKGICQLACLIATPCLAAHVGAQDNAERRDSAGVALISAPVTDRSLPWRITRTGTLGGASAEELLPHLVPGAGIAALSDGTIVATDRERARVLYFRPDGALERTSGGRGGGPGEYQILGGVATNRDTVVVYDVAAPHFTLLSGDGRYVGTRVIPSRPWDRFAFAGGRFVAVTSQSPANQIELRLVAVAQDTVELARQTQELRPVPACGTTLPMTPYLLPPLAWAVRDRTVAASSSASYRIDVYGDARLAVRIARAIRPRRVTDDDVRREAGDGLTMRGGTGCRVAPDVLIRSRGAADVVPAISDLTIDPAGRLWVHRWAPRGTGALTDVFNADGTYLGTLPRGTPFPALFTGPDRFVAVEVDADGVQTLGLYHIAR